MSYQASVAAVEMRKFSSAVSQAKSLPKTDDGVSEYSRRLDYSAASFSPGSYR
jgi:hypothetical protein